MTPERWQDVKDIFHSALEIDPAQREAFLDKACAGHDVLRREVELLIQSHEQPGSFLETPPIENEVAARIDPWLRLSRNAVSNSADQSGDKSPHSSN